MFGSIGLFTLSWNGSKLTPASKLVIAPKLDCRCSCLVFGSITTTVQKEMFEQSAQILFFHQQNYCWLSHCRTEMYVPFSLSLSLAYPYFSSTPLLRNSLLSRNALSQTQLTENNTNTARANLIELARDLLLSNFIISKIESLENSMCFCFCLLLLLLPLLAHRH